jgi:hypothetical protein
MAIYDKNNVLITEVVSSATANPDVIEITNRLLDGSYHVQTIGTYGTKVDVVAYFTVAQKLVLDGIKRTSDLIKVVFDGKYYIGLIEGELKWNRYPNDSELWFGTQFILLVESEGVV